METDTELDRVVTDYVLSLLEICSHGVRGYEQAAEAVEDSELEQILRDYSNERLEFKEQLRPWSKIPKGETVTKNEGLLAALHRGWIALQSVFEGDVYVLYAVEQADNVALGVYEKADSVAMPLELAAIVRAQYERILATGEHLNELQIKYQVD